MIDCGFVKIRSYNPYLDYEMLIVVPVSKATAIQRAGRAGRNQSGKCFRLYSQQIFDNSLPSTSSPEMSRSNLVGVILQLKAMGISNILNFDFLSPPQDSNMLRALQILYSLGALDGDWRLTDPLGNTLVEFPVDPYVAKIVHTLFSLLITLVN